MERSAGINRPSAYNKKKKKKTLNSLTSYLPVLLSPAWQTSSPPSTTPFSAHQHLTSTFGISLTDFYVGNL
jgi:hypothetical protein